MLKKYDTQATVLRMFAVIPTHALSHECSVSVMPCWRTVQCWAQRRWFFSPKSLAEISVYIAGAVVKYLISFSDVKRCQCNSKESVR